MNTCLDLIFNKKSFQNWNKQLWFGQSGLLWLRHHIDKIFKEDDMEKVNGPDLKEGKQQSEGNVQ